MEANRHARGNFDSRSRINEIGGNGYTEHIRTEFISSNNRQPLG